MNDRYKERGTKFRIYPQPPWLEGFSQPVTIYINAAPGTIKAGPKDQRIYVVDALNKEPYKETGKKPPYTEPTGPPAEPSGGGHFDRIKPRHRTFKSATVFATVRSVLEIWEHYFGRKLPWYFRRRYLEVIPLIDWENAFSRPGYIELGFADRAHRKPFYKNFDVVAHEVGHAVMWNAIGYPKRRSLVYRAHEEAAADVVAIVAALHFKSVVARVLKDTQGHLFSKNVLSRLGDLRGGGREPFDSAKMSTVKKHTDPDIYKYNLSLPFTGGAYDLLVKMYQQRLVTRGAISKELAERSCRGTTPADTRRIRQEFRQRFNNRKAMFRAALRDARDDFGRLLARTWARTSARRLSHERVTANMIAADAALYRGKHGRLIHESFEWREILPARAR